MSKTIKIRASINEGHVVVKALLRHPMETGRRKDAESGELVPAHYIKSVKAEYDGKQVFNAYWGTGVSQNPYVSFKFKGGQAGDKIKLLWEDNKGETDMIEAVIK